MTEVPDLPRIDHKDMLAIIGALYVQNCQLRQQIQDLQLQLRIAVEKQGAVA